MLGFLRGFLWGLMLIGSGWLGGSIYPAPREWTAPIKQRADPLVAQIDFSPQGLARLRASLTPQQYTQLSQDAARLAASTGHALIVERDAQTDANTVEAAAVESAVVATPPPLPVGAESFEATLSLCPRMTISNAPPADAHGIVRTYARLVNVDGVSIATNPTLGACLSSMVGPRNGREHKGTDYYSADGGAILAAAAGTVVEKKYRDDYGNMLLIDHGHGVFTRYAHLSSFAPGVEVGARVAAGEQIGLMGNTAAYRIPVHLHYELLLGNYANPRGSFGLTPHSPFEYPSAG